MDPNAYSAPATVYQIPDPQHGLVLGAFDHPADWQAQSHVAWDFRQYGQPVKVFARAFHPNDPAMVEFLPAEAFCWIEPFMGFGQPGQDAGGGVFLLQPMAAADTLARWVIPKYRGTVPGLRIAGGGPIPDLMQRLGVAPSGNPAGGMREGAFVRVEYGGANNAQAIEEEFYGLKVQYPGVPSYGAAGTLMQYNWGFERLFSFRAAKGELNAIRDRCWSVARSVRLNPAWEQVHARVMEQLAQQFNQHLQAGYANIEAATRLSHQISANNDAWLHGQQQQREAAYQSDQRKRERDQAAWGAYTTNDAFGDAMMGRETYHDPNHEYGSQHSGYHAYVWTDGQSYQYSDDAGFDPNVGSSSNWVILKKKEVGE